MHRTNALVVATLLVMIAPLSANAAHAAGFEDMISPLSMPTVNEDPRPTTEIRPMYMYTKISDAFLTRGGHYHVVAIQLRAALTDRIGFIATKDGYIVLRPATGVPDDSGFANLAFGFKGVLYEDAERAFMLTGGLRYEAASGQTDVLQGRGVGVLNPFLSVAQGIGDLHLEAYTGPGLALSSNDSSHYDLALHADYRIADVFYPLLEFNWRYILRGGDRLPVDQEGFDLVNLGASRAGGESVATIAFGGRWRVLDGLDFGTGAEFPVTSRHDIFGWRVYTDFIWRPMGWGSLLQ